MARLLTIGYEIDRTSLNSSSSFSGDGYFGGGVVQSSVFRSGANACKCDSGAGNTTPFTQIGFTGALVTLYYGRAYFQFTNIPTATTPILRSFGAGNLAASVQMTTAGNFRLYADQVPGQIGSDSAISVTAGDGLWYRVEMLISKNTNGFGQLECKVNGVTIATSASAFVGSDTPDLFRMGWQTAPGANSVCYIDDVAINDSTGTSQNSYPGDGNVVLGLPISDNARGANWVAGAAGTTNLQNAVSNTPPVGVASGSAGITTQVRNATSDTTGNYDANITTYANMGIASGDTIVLVQPVWDVGCDSATATSGAELLVSNPSGGSETSVDFSAGAAIAGTWPTNWRTDWGAAVVGDIASGNRGTSPVMRIGKRAASTNVGMCDFMGLYVEYTPQAAAQPDYLRAGANRRYLSSTRW